MAFEEYWNENYKKKFGMPNYDDWLEKYKSILVKSKTPVLDLGCGRGNDSLYLSKLGLDVIACDYSEVALKNVKNFLPEVETKMLDISEPLPFKDEAFEIIIADLSLHYFNENTTKEVMKEVKRILKPNGYLFARVNSVNDVNFGAGAGEMLEKNYYYVNGYNKRFFDEQDILKYFSIIGSVEFVETTIIRNGKSKILFEINIQKNSNIDKN